MATQPIDRQRAKHRFVTSPKSKPLTQKQKQKLAEHEELMIMRRWIHRMECKY